MATWPPPFLQGLQAPAQPFFVQTPYGLCLYDPSTGVCSPPINPAAFTATNMLPPPQQQLAAPPAAPPPPPPAAAALPATITRAAAPAAPAVPPPIAPPPPPPPIVCVEQSAFSPSSDMVEALDAMSKKLWQFRHDLRPMQVRINGTLHEDTVCDGVLLAVDRTGGGKTHCMRMVCTYEMGIHFVVIPLLALTASIQSKMMEYNPSYGYVFCSHLDEQCCKKESLDKLIQLLDGVLRGTRKTFIILTSPHDCLL